MSTEGELIEVKIHKSRVKKSEFAPIKKGNFEFKKGWKVIKSVMLAQVNAIGSVTCVKTKKHNFENQGISN